MPGLRIILHDEARRHGHRSWAFDDRRLREAVRRAGRIYSEVGAGTMVCLYLPRYLGLSEAEAPALQPSLTVRAKQGETVLVVDDDSSIRMLVAEVLEELGYTAIEVADGPAGLEIPRSEVPLDLIVTDVGLPGGMNGRQALLPRKDVLHR